jgi:predicted nucleotide-binding protein/hypoxanthine phosphoribosyltransferase
MTETARVFIGSSNEELALAQALEALLARHGFDVNLWTNLGETGSTVTAILTKATRTNDFAIIILTGDDLTVSRKVRAPAPRDNLIFELGWFMSAFGPRRSFFVVEERVKTKLPTDLNGIIYTTFRRRETPRLTMSPTATELQDAIDQSMANPDDSQLAKEHSLRRNVVQLAQILDEGGFIPDLIVGVARGGLPAAGVLAQELGDEDDPPIPTVSILPDDEFRNDFNSYAVTRASFPGISERKINILVVDNVRQSGRTLQAARTYLAGRLGEHDFEIRTAAMTQYNGEFARRTAPADFVVRYSNRPVEVLGQLEPYGS